jgi:hypothetical protein
MELQIADNIKVYCPVEEIRLIRDKVTGESRGFAFVDFRTVEEAQAVMKVLILNTNSFIAHNSILLTISSLHNPMLLAICAFV